jgi:flagellin
MRINHNIAALNTHRQLNSASEAQGKSMEKLSSGLRINKAGDDAAGLAISEKMRGQIRGLDQASKNAQDGISMISTAEGALNETHDILQRMRELAVQSSNDTATQDDRKELQKEMNQLIEEIDRISTDTEFNTQNLLDGSYSGKKVHIGANEGQTMTIDISRIDSTTLGTNDENSVTETLSASLDFSATGDNTVNIGGTTVTLDKDFTGDGEGLARHLTNAFQSTEGVTVSYSQADNKLTFTASGSSAVDITFAGTDAATIFADTGEETTSTVPDTSTGKALTDLHTGRSSSNDGITTQIGAESAITALDNAIQKVSGERSKLGAYQNRLDHTINNLSTSSENLTAAESRIRDVDYALAA